MRGLLIAAAIAASAVASASAQPLRDTEKYQPAVLELRACIRAKAPPAHIAGIHTMDQAIPYFSQRCLRNYKWRLTALDAGDAVSGSFRLIVREEWGAFLASMGF